MTHNNEDVQKIAELNSTFMALNDKGKDSALTVLRALSFAQAVMDAKIGSTFANRLRTQTYAFAQIGGDVMAAGIKTAMQNKGITIEAVASLLKIHRNSASNKVNGETEFSVGEALALQSNMFPEYTMQYLYTEQKI